MASILSRRQFIRGAVACSCGVAAWGTVPGFSVKPAFGATGNGTKLLLINMNGGWDGLAILQPSSGPLFSTLTSLRSTLYTDPSQLLPVSSLYGFHPALPILKQLFDEGRLSSVLNVGYEHMSRSHLDAEVVFARGVGDRLTPQASGFIHRMGFAFQWNNLQAVSVTGADPAFAGGQYSGIQVRGLSQFRFTSDGSIPWSESLQRRDALSGLAAQWEVDPAKVKQREIVDSIDVANNTSQILQSALSSATFPQTYPTNQMGRALRDVEVLFSNPNLGTEVAYVRRGGLDTHSKQDETLVPILQELNGALTVFVNNMKAKGLWNNVVVVLLSEFGRTNRENGSQGTDHGGALPLFVAGGSVQSNLIGELQPQDLTDNGWLPMKINLVDVYRALVARMGYDPNQVFENSRGTLSTSLFT